MQIFLINSNSKALEDCYLSLKACLLFQVSSLALQIYFAQTNSYIWPYFMSSFTVYYFQKSSKLPYNSSPAMLSFYVNLQPIYYNGILD